VSVAANIAGGHGRETTASFIQFLRMAQGSLKELETHLILAQRLRLGSAAEIEAAIDRCDELGRMVRGLVRSLQEKSRGDD
jgi:four helix bundle protein